MKQEKPIISFNQALILTILDLIWVLPVGYVWYLLEEMGVFSKGIGLMHSIAILLIGCCWLLGIKWPLHYMYPQKEKKEKEE